MSLFPIYSPGGGPVFITSASGIYSGATGSMTFVGDDVLFAAGDKSIWTTDAFTGEVTVQYTHTGVFSEAGLGFGKASRSGSFSGTVATANTHGGAYGCTVHNQLYSGNYIWMHDWTNTDAMSTAGSSSSSSTNPDTKVCQLIRQDNGVVIYKIDGSTILTSGDSYTGPIHLFFGNHGSTTVPGNYDDVSIAAAGIN
jgi:hypothetical protein